MDSRSALAQAARQGEGNRGFYWSAAGRRRRLAQWQRRRRDIHQRRMLLVAIMPASTQFARCLVARASRDDFLCCACPLSSCAQLQESLPAESVAVNLSLDLHQRLVLDLADALAREVQPVAEDLQRLRLPVVQAEASFEHLALAMG